MEAAKTRGTKTREPEGNDDATNSGRTGDKSEQKRALVWPRWPPLPGEDMEHSELLCEIDS